jgi:hypothetical protein
MTAAGFARGPKYVLLRMHDDGLICARSGRPSVAELATIGGNGPTPKWRATADEDGHYSFAIPL